LTLKQNVPFYPSHTDFELTWFMDRHALQYQKCKSGRSYGHKIESITLHDME
jgi:hypothetical protein